jgi:trk system potassium uptake protein TrkH
MSGFSSAGASVIPDVGELTRAMAMWRQFTGWLGGLGIIVLFLAVLPRLNVAGRQVLFRTEAPGPEIGLEATIRATARRFLALYIAITVAEIVVLAALGLTGVDDFMTPYRAVALSFATIATAGMTTDARSIEPYDATTQWALVVFMVLAGTNFALLFVGIVRRRLRPFARDEEFRVYLVLLALASLVVLVALTSDGLFAGEEAVRHSVFTVTSMMTTTGWAASDYNAWGPTPQLVLFGLVMMGASAGATSGSIKLVRHVVIFKMLARELRHTVHPQLVAPLRLNREVVDEATLRAIIVFVFLYLGACAAGATAILVDSSLRGIELSAFESLADSAAALAGAGSGLGFAGPMGSFRPFSVVSRLVLLAEMYLGRLEIIPVLVLLGRSFWRP